MPLIGRKGVGRALRLLSVFCLLSSFTEAAKLDKSNDFNILDDVIEEQHRNEASEIDDNNLIYKSNANDTEGNSVEITAKVDEDKSKQFFKNQESSLGMDTLTIIWYLTTFTALFGFFVVMACTENSCQGRTVKPPDAQTSPPTPCPSYKNFAPPSYGSVMKKLKNQKIYIVPVHEGDNNFFSNPLQNDTTAAPSLTSTPTPEATVVNVDIEKNEL